MPDFFALAFDGVIVIALVMLVRAAIGIGEALARIDRSLEDIAVTLRRRNSL